MRERQQQLLEEFLRPHLKAIEEKHAKCAELEALIESSEAALQSCREQVRPLRQRCLDQQGVIAEAQRVLAGFERDAGKNQHAIYVLESKLKQYKADLQTLTQPAPADLAPIVRSIPHAHLPQN